MSRKKKLESSLGALFSKPVPSAVEPENPVEETISLQTPEESMPVDQPAAEVFATVAPEAAAAVIVEREPEAVMEKIELPVITPEIAAPVAAARVEPAATLASPAPSKPAPAKSAPAPVETQRATEEEDLELVFIINQTYYGVQVNIVQTIIKPQQVFPVPGTPANIMGLINLRGQIVPVVNMRNSFGYESRAIDHDTRFIVVEFADIIAALVVDSVAGVERIPMSQVEAPNVMVTSGQSSFLRGVAHLDERLVLLLKLQDLIKRRGFA